MNTYLLVLIFVAIGAIVLVSINYSRANQSANLEAEKEKVVDVETKNESLDQLVDDVNKSSNGPIDK